MIKQKEKQKEKKQKQKCTWVCTHTLYKISVTLANVSLFSSGSLGRDPDGAISCLKGWSTSWYISGWEAAAAKGLQEPAVY